MAVSQYLGWSYVFAWAINKIPLMYTIIQAKTYGQIFPHEGQSNAGSHETCACGIHLRFFFPEYQSPNCFWSMYDPSLSLISNVFVLCSSFGVSPDMVALMISGAYPYTIYKCVMYFSRTLKVRIQTGKFEWFRSVTDLLSKRDCEDLGLWNVQKYYLFIIPNFKSN